MAVEATFQNPKKGECAMHSNKVKKALYFHGSTIIYIL